MRTEEMTKMYPASMNVDRDALIKTINLLMACSGACTACADACLSEEMVGELRKCIRTNMDCADICDATARVLSRHTGYDANITRTQLEAAIQACSSCADECEAHAQMHEHCRVCAESCRAALEGCQDLLASMSN